MPTGHLLFAPPPAQMVPSCLASSSKGNTPSASTTARRRYGVSFPCAKLDSPTSSLASSVLIRTIATGCRSVPARKIPDSLMGFHRAIRVQSYWPLHDSVTHCFAASFSCFVDESNGLQQPDKMKNKEQRTTTPIVAPLPWLCDRCPRKSSS
jgi:hypothetical protein